jgi:hypothetical protein
MKNRRICGFKPISKLDNHDDGIYSDEALFFFAEKSTTIRLLEPEKRNHI